MAAYIPQGLTSRTDNLRAIARAAAAAPKHAESAFGTGSCTAAAPATDDSP
jgi:hypothetical protein